MPKNLKPMPCPLDVDGVGNYLEQIFPKITKLELIQIYYFSEAPPMVGTFVKDLCILYELFAHLYGKLDSFRDEEWKCSSNVQKLSPKADGIQSLMGILGDEGADDFTAAYSLALECLRSVKPFDPIAHQRVINRVKLSWYKSAKEEFSREDINSSEEFLCALQDMVPGCIGGSDKYHVPDATKELVINQITMLAFCQTIAECCMELDWLFRSNGKRAKSASPLQLVSITPPKSSKPQKTGS